MNKLCADLLESSFRLPFSHTNSSFLYAQSGAFGTHTAIDRLVLVSEVHVLLGNFWATTDPTTAAPSQALTLSLSVGVM